MSRTFEEGTPADRLTIEDLILLLASGASGPYPLDPVRIMKGAFLISMRGRKEWRTMFRFAPYAYGPFDVGVYTARDALVTRGFLGVSHGYYDTYTLTASGLERVAELTIKLDEDVAWIRAIGRYVTSRSFDSLLREIYATYPDFAIHSRFKK